MKPLRRTKSADDRDVKDGIEDGLPMVWIEICSHYIWPDRGVVEN